MADSDFLAPPTKAQQDSIGKGVVDLFVSIADVLGGGGKDDAAAQAAAAQAAAIRKRNMMIVGAALALVGGVVVYRFVLKK